jgi:hypothetical protein
MPVNHCLPDQPYSKLPKSLLHKKHVVIIKHRRVEEDAVEAVEHPAVTGLGAIVRETQRSNLRDGQATADLLR